VFVGTVVSVGGGVKVFVIVAVSVGEGVKVSVATGTSVECLQFQSSPQAKYMPPKQPELSKETRLLSSHPPFSYFDCKDLSDTC
jgi:hypothetical protein